MLLRPWVVVALCLSLAVASSAKERTWTTSDGRQMRGEFVRELDGEVTLLVDGKLLTLPLARLSERDQQTARDLAAGKEVPDEPQPASESDAGSAAEAPDKPAAEDRAPPLVKRPPSPVTRVWTDAQGRKMTGKFVRVFGASVVISRAGGPITIPFFNLSEADQQYVKDFLTDRGEEELIPAQPPPAAAGEGNFGAGPGRPPLAAPPAGGGFENGPGPNPGPGFGPGGIGPGGIGPAGPSNPENYGSPSGYDSQPAGGSTFLEEHQRRAEAAQREADRMQQESQDRIHRTTVLPSQPTFERVPVCSNCQSHLSDTEAQGTRCPRCGARWVYNHYDQNGSSGSSGAAGGNTRITGGRRADLFGDPQTERTVIGAIAVVVALGVVATVAFGVIAVAMAIASASKAGRKYQ
jgi:hypothetical protein